jgi:hypothetical protein
MFLITSPSLIFFIRGSQSGVDQRNYMMSTSPSDILFMTTLGNLGTTQNLCFTVQPETEVSGCNLSLSVTLSLALSHLDFISSPL